MLTKPKSLQPGDTVGLVAPASPPNQLNLEKGIAYLESQGLKVKPGKYLYKETGYLAGSDGERAADLNAMFADPDVQGIICACGGYGTGRMAQKLDYDLIREKPKIFWGYSDITFLHTAMRQKAGLVTFHGPMIASDMGADNWNPLSGVFFHQLFHTKPIVYDEAISPLETMIPGKAEGELVGGNLCLLVTTLGTEFEIETDGKILFIEDVNEEPRNIDRMLSQLWSAGKLNHIKGLVIGDFHNCTPGERAKSFTLEEVFSHYVDLIRVPALKGLNIGHCSPNIGIPLGTKAILDTEQKRLAVESGLV